MAAGAEYYCDKNVDKDTAERATKALFPDLDVNEPDTFSGTSQSKVMKVFVTAYGPGRLDTDLTQEARGENSYGGKGTVIVIEAQAPEGDAIASAEVMGNVKYSALSSTSYIYSFDKRMKPTKAQLNVARSTTEDLQRTSPCCNIV